MLSVPKAITTQRHGGGFYRNQLGVLTSERFRTQVCIQSQSKVMFSVYQSFISVTRTYLKDLSHGFRVTNRKHNYNEITRDYVNIVHGEAVWTL